MSKNKYVKRAIVDLSYSLIFFMALRSSLQWEGKQDISHILLMIISVTAVYAIADAYLSFITNAKIDKAKDQNDSHAPIARIKAAHHFKVLVLTCFGLLPAYYIVARTLGEERVIGASTFILIDLLAFALSIAGIYLYFKYCLARSRESV